MAISAFFKFDIFVQDVGRKVHNLNADTFKWLLTNTAPLVTNAVKADITEIGAGNGYVAGGPTITGTGFTQTSGIAKFIAAATTITAAGGAINPFRYVVLYNSTAAGGPLVGWYDYGAALTINDGESLKICKDAAGNGWDSTTPMFTFQ